MNAFTLPSALYTKKTYVNIWRVQCTYTNHQ